MKPSILTLPASTPSTLFGVGLTHGFRLEGGNIVLCVKVLQLDLSRVYHVHNVIYCNAVIHKNYSRFIIINLLKGFLLPKADVNQHTPRQLSCFNTNKFSFNGFQFMPEADVMQCAPCLRDVGGDDDLTNPWWRVIKHLFLVDGRHQGMKRNQ